MLTAALLDRLLHHAHIVQIAGESYRFLRPGGWSTFTSALTKEVVQNYVGVDIRRLKPISDALRNGGVWPRIRVVWSNLNV
jgi:hypothetical protein